MPRVPVAVPPALHPPALELHSSVSGWMEQMEREEQQQGWILLWGSVPVSGAQFLLALPWLFPSPSAFGFFSWQGGRKEQHKG